MNGPIIQLLVLAGIAVFLILRLRSVLGTREGFEKPPVPQQPRQAPDLEVIEGGPDRDITDHVEDGSANAQALAAMKKAEPSFNVSEFLSGARGAYEMILMGYENGQIEDLSPFLAPEVYDSFAAAIADRASRGETVDATFVGLSSLELVEATFDDRNRDADITVRFVGELTTVLRNADGAIIEGDPNTIVKQRDSWTFSRVMGAQDPNWRLVATGA